MADKRCDNGHFIDEAWDICPYCPAEGAGEVPGEAMRQEVPSRPRPAAQPVTAVSREVAPPREARRPTTPDAAASAVQVPQMERTVAASKIDAQKRYVVGWLVSLNGSTRGEAFSIRMGRNVIGRERRSDVAINDDQASSHHADLIFRPDERRFILMDHNSTNGTYVNEEEIEPRRDLGAGDVIRIGSHRLLFVPLCRDGVHWDDEGLLK